MALGPDPLTSGLYVFSGALEIAHGTNGASLMVISEFGNVFGNTINNPTTNFVGSGAVSGASFVPTGSTVPALGMYAPSITTMGFAVNGVPTAFIGATGAWTIDAPSSTLPALTVNAFTGAGPLIYTNAMTVNGAPAVTGFIGQGSMGLRVAGASGSSDYEGIDFPSAVGSSLIAARIAVNVGATTSFMSFGTSNNYTAGITNTALTISSAGICSALNPLDNIQYQVGFKGTPQNSQSGNYSLLGTDQGLQIYYVGAGAVTLSIPTSSPGFPVGTCIRVINDAATAIFIATAAQLVWSPVGTVTSSTGTPRTVAAKSSAVLEKVIFGGTERWWITGNGLS